MKDRRSSRYKGFRGKSRGFMASVPIILYCPHNGVPNHRFAALPSKGTSLFYCKSCYIEPNSIGTNIMKLAGKYNELFLEFKMHRT